MTLKPKKKKLAVGVAILFPFLCAQACFILSLTSARHSRVWHNAFEGIDALFLVVWMFVLYKFPPNTSAPDRTIHLFAKSTEVSPESHDQ